MNSPRSSPRLALPIRLTGPGALRAGFTLVEMLVVTAIIIVLLTILIAALARSARVAQRTNTQFLMNSINQGLVRFKEDFGYFPVVLEDDRDLAALPDRSSASYASDLQDWGSHTSLAEFLLGYGDRSQDGYGFVGDPSTVSFPDAQGSRELPTLGIRDPGEDGLWGAVINPRSGFPSSGLLLGRNLAVPGPGQQGNNDYLPGKVYGPYIDSVDPRILGSIDPSTGTVSLPGEAAFDEDHPKVFVDYWGRPIRYYRRVHSPGNPRSLDQRLVTATDRMSNLGDVFLLRPSEIESGREADGIADVNGDTTTTRALQSAEVALFSPGADRSFTADRRIDDPENYNRDNIVEVGP